MNYSNFSYNTKIQKISSAVLTGISSGKDPFQEIIKEAQRENFTPHLIKAACQHINNEIFIHHYNSNNSGKIQIIDPEKVIEALNVKEAESKVEKVASKEDYWDFKPKPLFEKTASSDEPDAVQEKAIAAYDRYKNLVKQAQERKTKEKLYDSIIKQASHIQDEKKKLKDDAMLSVRREYIPVEEVDFLYKTASDNDVKEVLKLVLDKCGMIVQNDLMKVADLFETHDVNHDSSILKRINYIVAEKKNLQTLVNQYKQYEK